MKSKVYTKTGDKGSTGLVGGTRVPKHHLKLDAYGTVDELNSYLGLVMNYIEEPLLLNYLQKVQHILFDMGAYLATEPDKLEKYKIASCTQEDIEEIEAQIDFYDEKLPRLTQFILPGGHLAVSHCHVARTICRRAERKISILDAEEEVKKEVKIYVNRLSDFLFILARKLAQDLCVAENKWSSKKL